MIKIDNKQKVTIMVMVVLIVFCMAVMAVQDTFLPLIASASTIYNFDNTDVLEDLKSSKVNGQGFDLREYPYVENGRLSIINFVEFGYSYRSNQNSNYALYIYMYNPMGIDIDVNSSQNKIEMAVAWETDIDGDVVATKYEKFGLRFCNKSSGNYDGLFYKYRVIDHKVDGKSLYQRVNSIERRYDISGVELKMKGDINAIDYGVGGTYKFTGYAAGLGSDVSAASTLDCLVEDLDTLRLQVHHTNYRTGVSDLGKHHYNNVDTVYFSVPDNYFKSYGNLQRIHAEWWEYKIKSALVSAHEDFINFAKPYRTNHVENYNPANLTFGTLYDKNIPFGVYGATTSDDIAFAYNFYDIFGNHVLENDAIPKPTDKDLERLLNRNIPLMFYSKNVESVDSIFDFLYTHSKVGDVSSSIVANAIYEYSNLADEKYGYYDCNGRQISKDLFEANVDIGRNQGYNNVNIDLKDTFDLNSYDSNHSWIEKLFSYGFSSPKTDEAHDNVLPIYELKASDLIGTDNSISSKLLVNKNDIENLRTFYTAEALKGNHVILFRFANTDYYCQPATCLASGFGNNDVLHDNYIVQQTVFLDFDIIDLTFNKDGNYRVIPVVSNPMDIINGFTAPPSSFDWWKLIVGLIVFIIVLVILQLTGILPLIGKIVGWIICLPFKLIGSLFKAIFKGKSDKKKTNNKKKKKDKSLNKNIDELRRFTNEK